MITSFGDAFTEDIFNGVRSARARRFPADVLARAMRMLDRLQYATVLSDLAVPPGNRLESLQGNLAGFHSVRINGQWRVIFRWTDAGPADVRITDYH